MAGIFDEDLQMVIDKVSKTTSDPPAQRTVLAIGQPVVSMASRSHRASTLRTSNPDAVSKGKAKRGGRNVGKLSKLMYMPLDVFFEITSKLLPVDLLQLSRVSKHFRRTFMTKSARLLWVAARGNVHGLPPPPSHLSEPKYAALLFESICFACGVNRSPKVDFEMCVRFCGPCWKENVVKGSIIHRQMISDINWLPVLRLVPHERRGTFYMGNGLISDIWKSHFYVPEVDAVLEHIKSLDGEAKEAFVAERLQLVQDMENHALAISRWQLDSLSEKFEDELRAKTNRKESIERKLVGLGYSKDDFPSDNDHEWMRLVGQPRELTSRIWKQIQPKLEACIANEAQLRKCEKLASLYTSRERQLQELYSCFCEANNLRENNYKDGPYPLFKQLLSLDPVAELVGLEPEGKITEEQFNEYVVPLLGEERKRMQDEILEALKRVLPMAERMSENPDLDANKILLSASSMFICLPCNFHILFDFLMAEIPPFYSYTEYCDHISDSHQNDYNLGITCLPTIGESAKKILEHTGLTKDTPYSEVSGKIVCLCKDSRLEQPTSFSKLLRHYYCEVITHEKMNVHPMSDAIYYADDHDLSSPSSRPVFRLLGEDESMSVEEFEEPSFDLSELPEQVGCRLCVEITDGAISLPPHARRSSPRDWVNHVRAKHLREPSESDWYGSPATWWES